MPTHLRDPKTLILTLESSHLKRLLQEKEPLVISYNGYEKLKIAVYKPIEGVCFPEKRKRTISYKGTTKEFIIFLNEDDIPIDAMDILTLDLPETPQKIKTLIITCPFRYKK